MSDTTSATTATIKFFNASGGSSDTESDDADLSMQGSSPVKVNSGTNDEWERRARQTSIYDDLPSESPTFSLSHSHRKRTDSDSNLLWNDEDAETSAADQPLILDVTEDHFGLPEDLTRLRDITVEIEKLKQQIFHKLDHDPEKRRLIDKLISLRLRKSELENQADMPAKSEQVKQIYGHDFHQKESTSDMERFCEVCCSLVWGVLQTWYTCTSCHICCHDKCLNSLKRMCTSKKVTESSGFITTICPDKGLHSQHYKCYECQVPITYKPGGTECRQCDYTGFYYCPSCHWNDEVIIPARVVNNWDFVPKKVCRASKQYLRLLYRKPVISLEKTYPYLFKFVEELNEMKKLREEILLMKMYFLSCQTAMQGKILLHLESRQHFVENSDMYSLADLVELVSEKLLPSIVNVHAIFASHIKVECTTCNGKGYICEICKKQEIIFPFDNICISCPVCSNVFHKHCYKRAQNVCPRCERKRKRMEENEHKAYLLRQIELCS